MTIERKTFWVMTCDRDCDEDEIADDWPQEREKVQGYTERDAVEQAAADALDGMDDGDEIDVIIATCEDGSDARRCTVTLSIQIDYDQSTLEPIDLSPEPIDEETGEPVKGLKDDATLPLFGEVLR